MVYSKPKLRKFNPENVPKRLALSYSQAIQVESGIYYLTGAAIPPTWLYISGQVGIDNSGKVQQGAEVQLDQIWRNILGILESAKMGPENIVKVNTFLTRPQDVPLSWQVRERALGEHKPASTLLIVASLASPDYLAEIEAIAAR